MQPDPPILRWYRLAVCYCCTVYWLWSNKSSADSSRSDCRTVYQPPFSYLRSLLCRLFRREWSATEIEKWTSLCRQCRPLCAIPIRRDWRASFLWKPDSIFLCRDAGTDSISFCWTNWWHRFRFAVLSKCRLPFPPSSYLSIGLRPTDCHTIGRRTCSECCSFRVDNPFHESCTLPGILKIDGFRTWSMKIDS